ncbi:putative inorganic phosphate cotransporter [Musca vetustissima]|uniref:putative inorganic phosphate cotransporter n=1 Tax=Musca vetustissima TaxID=27455 RepID=UPI002AB798BE|nr:putative inorganic phosphate cotransporter [Musca vetustissima]
MGHTSLEVLPTSKTFGIRHLQCLLLALGLSVGYATRVNLSVAIVAMTDMNDKQEGVEIFQWTEKQKSMIQSSFFFGYVVTQIPAGYLCRVWGAKCIFLWGNIISSTLALLTPYLVMVGDWQLLIVARVIQGFSQGVMFPCTHSVLSRWSPPGERATLCGLAYAGTFLGAVVMFGSSGWIISCLHGWPSIFYISGVLGFMWCLVWHMWGANTPHSYKNISPEEKSMILKSLEQPTQNTEKRSEAPAKTPLREIVKSLPCWALLVDHCAHNWGFWTLLTQLPTYMKYILNMNIQSNALFSALPYLIMLLLTFFFGYLADLLHKRQWVSTNVSRKLLNTIGQWLPMVSLVALGFCDSSHLMWAVTFIVLAVGLNSSSFLGFQVNHMDLSPNFASVLMGITNTAANLMSIFAPLTVGIVVTDVTNPLQWRIVFFIAAGFYFVGNLSFLVFGQTKVQKWNEPSPQPLEMQLMDPSPSSPNKENENDK